MEKLNQESEVKSRDEIELDRVQAVIKKHQKRQSIGQGNSIHEQVDLICEEYQRGTENAYSQCGQFRDRIITDLRALNLIITSALNSETHKEKDAHLRIVTKLLGSAIEHLRETHFSQVWGAQFFFNRDPFQCDFPVREMKNRIYELENELKQFKPNETPAPLSGETAF